MDEQRFKALFERYLEDRLSPEELRELLDAVQDDQLTDLLDDALKNAFSEAAYREDDAEVRQAALAKVLSAIHGEREEERTVPKRRIIGYRWLSGVAAMLLLATGAGWLFYQHHHTTPQHQQMAVNDIQPGVNQATLTLANGHRIILSANLKGTVAQQAGVTITKTPSGEILYTAQASDDQQVLYNTLATARHEQFQIILPDGSHVWLNAASSLKYPVTFSGNERRVELTGEAYFEVAHNAALPFKVKTETQEVEVLGTHFNIKAYEDERSVKTTLLEGSVRVSDQSGRIKLLRPGQQAVHTSTQLSVSDIDTEEAVAWKNGYFMFEDNEELGSAMRKVARWYDIDVVYEDPELAKQLIAGSITRFTNASKVLEMLHKVCGVHFKIEGRKVSVTK